MSSQSLVLMSCQNCLKYQKFYLKSAMSGEPLSFAFKRSSKSINTSHSRTKKKENDREKVFISEFNPDSVISANGGTNVNGTTEAIIPKQENSFGGKNSFIPKFVPRVTLKKTSISEDRFEAAAPSEVPKDDMKYGLHERNSILFESTSNDFVSESKTSEQVALEALKSEIASLPNEANHEAYEKMPVDVFGRAMLRGMGWKEGDSLGKDKTKKPSEAVEFIPRVSRLGLGAAPDVKTRNKTGPAPMVLPVKGDGRVRHVRGLDEELVPYDPAGMKEGQIVRIVSGKHKGFTCTIMQSPYEGSVKVKLPNEEIIQVSVEDVGEFEKSKTEESNPPRSKRRKTNNSSMDMKSSVFEMIPKMRVRIINKELDDGAYYLKKGAVVDIVRPGVANILLDKSKKLLENVQCDSIEVLAPEKKGSEVLILTGEYQGQKGNFIKQDTDSGFITIQLLSDLSIHQFSLNQISEYKDD